MVISYFNISVTPFERVTVDGVKRIDLGQRGVTYWKHNHYYWYLSFNDVSDVRVYTDYEEFTKDFTRSRKM